MVAIVAPGVMRVGVPAFEVSGAPSLGVANPSTCTASACAQRTAGPSCSQANSLQRKPVVSHAGTETASNSPSRPATLVGFTHVTGQSKPRVLEQKSAPLPALARSALWDLAGMAGAPLARCELRHDNRPLLGRTLAQRLPSRAAGVKGHRGCLRSALPLWSRGRGGQMAVGSVAWPRWLAWSCQGGRARKHHGCGWSLGHQPPLLQSPAALRWCYAGSRPTPRSSGRAEKRRWSMLAFRRRAA